MDSLSSTSLNSGSGYAAIPSYPMPSYGNYRFPSTTQAGEPPAYTTFIAPQARYAGLNALRNYGAEIASPSTDSLVADRFKAYDADIDGSNDTLAEDVPETPSLFRRALNRISELFAAFTNWISNLFSSHNQNQETVSSFDAASIPSDDSDGEEYSNEALNASSGLNLWYPAQLTEVEGSNFLDSV